MAAGTCCGLGFFFFFPVFLAGLGLWSCRVERFARIGEILPCKYRHAVRAGACGLKRAKDRLGLQRAKLCGSVFKPSCEAQMLLES